MTNGLSGPRKQFLDVLRVLATCAVVLMHVLTGATDVTDASILKNIAGGLHWRSSYSAFRMQLLSW